MNVTFNSSEIHRKDVHFVGLKIFLRAVSLTIRNYILHILIVIEVSYISRVKNIIDVFKHLLVDDLSIGE